MNESQHYKYYILDKGCKGVSGVVSDDNDIITYHALTIYSVKNKFNGYDEDLLLPYYTESGTPTERQCHKTTLAREYPHTELTTNYWTAWEHATGRKRKAINTNDTTN